MKRYLNLALSTLFFMAHMAMATPTNPISGAEYIQLTTPQTTSATGKKVEAIDFFMYHCPACYMLEPALSEWVKKQADKVAFKRIHVPHTGARDVEAHLFLTLEAMQKENALHSKVLHTWHVEHIQLTKDDDNIDWAVKNGINKEQFLAYYNSFSVISKLQNLEKLAAAYQVNNTPTIVIDGRYLTSMALVQASNKEITRDNIVKATLEVADALVARQLSTKP